MVDKSLFREAVESVLRNGVTVGDIIEIAPGLYQGTAKGVTRAVWSDIDRILISADAERRNFSETELRYIQEQLVLLQEILTKEMQPPQ